MRAHTGQEFSKFAVIRKAVIMEDEGREEFIDVFPSYKEARAWIDSQKGEYFAPSDYYIMERRTP